MFLYYLHLQIKSTAQSGLVGQTVGNAVGQATTQAMKALFTNLAAANKVNPVGAGVNGGVWDMGLNMKEGGGK